MIYTDLYLNDLKKNNFDNISLIDYIKENIEKEVKYQYENIELLFDNIKIENKKLLNLLYVKEANNIYLKNENKKLCLELEEVHNSKLWKLINKL